MPSTNLVNIYAQCTSRSKLETFTRHGCLESPDSGVGWRDNLEMVITDQSSPMCPALPSTGSHTAIPWIYKSNIFKANNKLCWWRIDIYCWIEHRIISMYLQSTYTTSYILLYVITNHSIFNIYLFLFCSHNCDIVSVWHCHVSRGHAGLMSGCVMRRDGFRASQHHAHSRFQENINLPTWQYAAVCRRTRPEHTTTRSTLLVASMIASRFQNHGRRRSILELSHLIHYAKLEPKHNK